MVAGIAGAYATTAAIYLEYALTPALALMLFATFMQMPITGMGRLFREKRFVCALLTSDFCCHCRFGFFDMRRDKE